MLRRDAFYWPWGSLTAADVIPCVCFGLQMFLTATTTTTPTPATTRWARAGLRCRTSPTTTTAPSRWGSGNWYVSYPEGWAFIINIIKCWTSIVQMYRHWCMFALLIFLLFFVFFYVCMYVSINLSIFLSNMNWHFQYNSRQAHSRT